MTEAAYSADTSFDGMLAASGVVGGTDQSGDVVCSDDDGPDAEEYIHTRLGRPSKLTPELIARAQAYAECGAIDVEIAAYLGIDVATLYRWQHSSSAFCEALNSGKGLADDRVERGLFKRAIGYEADVEKAWCFQGEVTKATVREHVPGDVGAQMHWLKNRRPDKWRDRSDVNVSLSLMDILAQAIAPTAEQPAIEATARDVTPPDAPDDAE